MTEQKSQLILPVTIVTLMIFAFLGLVIASGELQLSAPRPPERSLRIDYVAHHCPEGIDTDITALPASEAHSEALAALCNDKEFCTIDTRRNIPPVDDNPSCTSEIIVRFFCLKDANVKYVLHEKPSIAFLYEGQAVTLSCSNPSHQSP